MSVIVTILGSKWHQNRKWELLACQVTFWLEIQELVVEMDGWTVSFSPCNTEHWQRGAGGNCLLVSSQGFWE